jgi:hypothetical protein
LGVILIGKPVSTFPGSCRHLTPQRPSQPAPRSVTIAQTSLMVARAGRIDATDLPDDAREISDFRITTSLKRN